MVPHFDAELKVRVERLLSGRFKPDDLTTLFLALRDRADGREAVIEVGDFVAHRDRRNKGIITRTVRDFFLIIRFMFGPEREQAGIDNLPGNIEGILQASFRRVENKTVRLHTGMSRVAAAKVLKGLIERIRTHQNGRHYLWLPTPGELSLLNCLTSTMRAMPAFNEDGLFDEFAASLAANKLISPRDIRLLASLKGTIALFALTHMHQSIIDLGDGTEARLNASALGDAQGHIVVFASAELNADNKNLTVAHPIFVTSQTLANCDPAIQGESHPWPFPLELDAAKRLSRLGG
ncbi:MAG: hypothetical protein E5W19_23255 [Mesorhizobium sp.]|nr:MAG: hypothetical protein E5W19_23255 [Mesorhizobium sp.]